MNEINYFNQLAEEKLNKIKTFGKIISIIFLIIGFIILFNNFINSYNITKKTKDYITTKAIFIESESYSHASENYKLIYEYEIDGEKYIIKTKYGTSIIPIYGTLRDIKYNPNNYSESVFIKENYFVQILIGSILIFISMIIFLGLSNNNKRKKLLTIISIIFDFLLGFLTYYSIASFGNTYNIIDVFKNVGFVIIFPILFIFVGIKEIVSIVIKKSKKNKIYRESSENTFLIYITLVIKTIVYIFPLILIIILIINIIKTIDILGIIILPFLIVIAYAIIKNLIIKIKINKYGYVPDVEENQIKNNQIIVKLFETIFLIYWFGFCIFFQYVILTTAKSFKEGVLEFLFSLVFLGFGLLFLKNIYYKNKK